MTVTAQGTLAFNTVKAQNAAFFSGGLTPKSGGGNTPSKMRITIWVSTTGCILQATRDGTNFGSLNLNAALVASTWYILEVMVRAGDSFNLQASNAAGCTIGALTVDEIVDEG